MMSQPQLKSSAHAQWEMERRKNMQAYCEAMQTFDLAKMYV